MIRRLDPRVASIFMIAFFKNRGVFGSRDRNKDTITSSLMNSYSKIRSLNIKRNFMASFGLVHQIMKEYANTTKFDYYKKCHQRIKGFAVSIREKRDDLREFENQKESKYPGMVSSMSCLKQNNEAFLKKYRTIDNEDIVFRRNDLGYKLNMFN